jgi:hypothetical protein
VSWTPVFYTAGFVTYGHLHAGGVGNLSVEAFDLLYMCGHSYLHFVLDLFLSEHCQV